MKKINAYNPRTKKIEESGYFTNFENARRHFNNILTGYYRLYDDATGIYKKAFFK